MTARIETWRTGNRSLKTYTQMLRTPLYIVTAHTRRIVNHCAHGHDLHNLLPCCFQWNIVHNHRPLHPVLSYVLPSSFCSCKITFKKAVLSQRWPRDGCSENFRESLSTATATFPQIFRGLLFRSILWMCVRTKFEVRSFTRSRDNRGYFKKLGSPWICPRSFFSKILIGFCSDGPCERTAKF